MRDGVKLFTSVYVPKDLSQKYPIMLDRTPYSVAPYGLDNYRKELGPSEKFGKDGFIFVYQDVRGGNMAHLNYYAGLCGYIHAKKQGSLVFGNPGTNTVEDYFKYNAADALMIFEYKSTAYPGFQPSSWVRYYPAARFSNTVYAVPSASTMSSYVTKAKSQNAGWVFITNDKLRGADTRD